MDDYPEPEDGDYTTEDHVRWYQYGKLVLETLDQEYRHVLAHMEANQFWPNAWFISDHGNAHLIDLTD